METWAHGHEVFDVLGKERPGNDNIKIFTWALLLMVDFYEFEATCTRASSYVKLEAPSGAVGNGMIAVVLRELPVVPLNFLKLLLKSGISKILLL